MKKNTLLTLIIICITLMGVFYFVSREKMKKISSLGSGITAPFEIDPGKITYISISNSTKTVTIALTDDIWRVVDKSNYPADFKKIYEFILSVLQIKPVQIVTEKKDYYDRFGVEDPGDNSSTLISFLDKDKKDLLKIILGQQRTVSQGMPGGQYIRVFGKNQVYLITKELDASANPVDWLNKDIVDIPRKDIRSITVTAPQDEDKIVLTKKEQGGEFELDSLPDNKKINTAIVNSLSDGLTGLRYEDVFPKDSEAVKDLTFDTTYTATLFNGSVYKVDVSQKDDKVYIKVAASYEAPTSEDEMQKADVKKAEDVIQNPAVVMQKVEEQSALFSKWIYQISSYRKDRFVKTKSELLEDKELNKEEKSEEKQQLEQPDAQQQ